MKILNKSLLAVGLLAFGSLSQAATVTQWIADVTGIWTSYSPVVTNVDMSADKKTLLWGTNGKSSLVINDPAQGATVTTYLGGGDAPIGLAVDSISLTHNNFVISEPSLKTATLGLTVKLTPKTPAVGPTENLPLVNYGINFKETTNSGTCVVLDSPTKCNDIFALTGGFLNTSFVYDNQKYFVNAFPLDNETLGALTPKECAAAGVAAGCLGFTTPEKKSTKLKFGFTISTEEITNNVPEPGSLALLGLAMAGMGAVSRRRSAKQTKA